MTFIVDGLVHCIGFLCTKVWTKRLNWLCTLENFPSNLSLNFWFLGYQPCKNGYVVRVPLASFAFFVAGAFDEPTCSSCLAFQKLGATAVNGCLSSGFWRFDAERSKGRRLSKIGLG